MCRLGAGPRWSRGPGGCCLADRNRRAPRYGDGDLIAVEVYVVESEPHHFAVGIAGDLHIALTVAPRNVEQVRVTGSDGGDGADGVHRVY